MIKEYSRSSWYFGLPGFLICAVSRVMASSARTQADLEGAQGIGTLGVILFIVGCSYYARAKGRSGWWGLFGLLNLIGLIVLASLEDRSGEGADDGVGLTGGKGDAAHLAAVAEGHKRLLFGFFFLMAMQFGQFFVRFLVDEVAKAGLIHDRAAAAGLVWMGLSIGGLVVSIYLIVVAWGVASRVGWGGATALLVLLPFVSLLFLLLLNRRIMSFLRANGLKTGFWGVHPDDITALKTKGTV